MNHPSAATLSTSLRKRPTKPHVFDHLLSVAACRLCLFANGRKRGDRPIDDGVELEPEVAKKFDAVWVLRASSIVTLLNKVVEFRRADQTSRNLAIIPKTGGMRPSLYLWTWSRLNSEEGSRMERRKQSMLLFA